MTFPGARLVKLMMMTTSDNDAEALAAMRKANVLLDAVGLNWDELLAEPPEPEPRRCEHKAQPGRRRGEPPTSAHVRASDGYMRDEVDAMFATVYAAAYLSDASQAFVNGLHDYWTERGFLTERQYEVLRSMAAKHEAM
jgi:hypothetical protein